MMVTTAILAKIQPIGKKQNVIHQFAQQVEPVQKISLAKLYGMNINKAKKIRGRENERKINAARP